MARKEPYVQVTERIIDYPVRLSVDGTRNIGVTIVSPVGPRLAFISSPNEFLKNYTVNGVDIPRNADITFINAYYMSFFAGLVVARSMNSDAVGGLAIVYNENPNEGESELSKIPTLFKDGVELIKNSTVTIDKTLAKAGEDSFGFIIDGILYYGGDHEEVCEKLVAYVSDDEGNGVTPIFVNFASLESKALDSLYEEGEEYNPLVDLVAALNRTDNYVAEALANGIKFYHDEYTEISINRLEALDEDGIPVDAVVTPYNVNVGDLNTQDAYSIPEGQVKLMLIQCTTPQVAGNDGNIYHVKFGKTRNSKGHRIFNIALRSDAEEEYSEYVVSFDKEATDSSDINCFIDVLNTIDASPYVFQVVADDSVAAGVKISKEFGPVDFGEALINVVACASPAYLTLALDTLEDQEQYKIHYLAPCGITNIAYLKTFCSMGQRNKWFCPVDVPYDRTNENSIKAFGANIPDSYNNIVLGPFDKNSGLTGWINYIGASTLYWERVFVNRSQNSEWAPVFDERTGLLAYTNPVKLLKKSAREKLINLALPIDYIKYNMNTGAYFLNDNWTHYSLNENVAGEENNVRCHHIISLDVAELMKQFKAKHNTTKTRSDAYDAIDQYMKSNIMNQNFKPMEYLIICNESNNTDEVINARKLAVNLKVRYYNSTKYIDVINDMYSVGGSEFQE